MRFLSLHLERYGLIDTCTLDFCPDPGPANPGLHVIYGANEAGKSTCLDAVTDFLFGIPHTSPRGQVFGYPAMRLDGRVSLADGQVLDLSRRKKASGRGLSDAAGTSLDEAVLGRLLGPTTRDRFLTLFGLNHETLRRGGDHLLAAEGDIGRLILEAGGGLHGLVGTIADLDSQADAIFGLRKKSDRQFYQFLDRHDSASRQIREAAVARETVEAANDRITTAETALMTARATLDRLRQTQFHEQRVERIAPLMHSLVRLRTAAEAFADLPDVPRDFGHHVAEAQQQAASARKACDEAADALATLDARMAAGPDTDAILSLAAEIADSVIQATHVAKERVDRQNRLDERADTEARLAALKAHLQHDHRDDLANRIPDAARLAQTRQMVQAAHSLAERRAALDSRLAEDHAALTRLNQRLTAHQAAGTDQPFGLMNGAFADLQQTLQAAAEREQTLARLDRDLAARTSTWGCATIAELAALVLPLPDVIQGEIEQRERIAATRLRMIERAGDSQAAYDRAMSEIARLAAGPAVPTDAAIEAARRHRDGLWAAVRAGYLAADPLIDRHTQATALTDAILAADRLIDRRATETERITALKAAEQTRDAAAAQRAAATDTLNHLTAEREDRQRQWAAVWPAAAARAATPEGVKDLAAARLDILRRAEDRAALADEAARLRARAAPDLADLALAEQHLGLMAADLPVGERTRRVRAAIARHDDRYADYRTDLKARDETEARLARHHEERQTLDDDNALWHAAWPAVLVAIGLDSRTATLEQAAAIADHWAAATGTLTAMAQTQRRLDRMDEDLATLTRTQATIRAALGDDQPWPDDPVAAAAELSTRLEAARAMATTQAALAGERIKRAQDLTRHQQALAAAEQRLETLAAVGGVAVHTLGALAERHEARRQLDEDRHQLEERIAAAGDGHPLDELWQDWHGRDLDVLRMTLAGLRDDIRRHEAEVESLLSAIAEARRARAVLDHSGPLLAAVTAREAAAAGLHDSVGRYLTLRLAQDLLTAAIEHVRAERQNPLIARAGAIFAALTGHRFSGISADVDERRQPVVTGRRANGDHVPVTVMSDGTRDQMFLAFRIASIEHYCVATEPLPFIADDLMVHFDDERSAATLDLLCTLGQTTQVLLFTHHYSLYDQARALAAEKRAQVIEL